MLMIKDFAEMSLEEFDAELSKIDWLYAYSDDYRVWKQWSDYLWALNTFLRSELATDEHRAIYRKHEPKPIEDPRD